MHEAVTETLSHSLSLSLYLYLSLSLTNTLSLSVQRSPRSEAPLCFLRLEHGARVLGEGARVTCEAGEGVMGGGVEGTIHCNHSQRESVDELLQNPIIGQISLCSRLM